MGWEFWLLLAWNAVLTVSVVRVVLNIRAEMKYVEDNARGHNNLTNDYVSRVHKDVRAIKDHLDIWITSEPERVVVKKRSASA